MAGAHDKVAAGGIGYADPLTRRRRRWRVGPERVGDQVDRPAELQQQPPAQPGRALSRGSGRRPDPDFAVRRRRLPAVWNSHCVWSPPLGGDLGVNQSDSFALLDLRHFP